MKPVHFSVRTAGEGDIAATYWPAADPKGAVLIHPATGVVQGYYEGFARYLTGLGLSAVTYDYRGTGRSRPASLRACRVSMSDWINEDIAAITGWAMTQLPELALLAVGHSVGGHAIGLSPDSNKLRAAVFVASHAGVTATIRGWFERTRVWFLMRIAAPVLCSLVGYMPGRRLGLFEDLPRGVMMQWSRWTSLPRYFFDDPALDAARRMGEVRIPILVLGFDDDPWANPDAIDLLISHLPNAPIERRQYGPRDAGVAVIGHMGFFRRRCETVLWREVGAWLLAHSQAAATPARPQSPAIGADHANV